MIKTAQIEMNGRRYQVSFDFAREHDPMVLACRVQRIRKDGSLGQILTGITEIHHALTLSGLCGPL
jgi:hypothetical protein